MILWSNISQNFNGSTFFRSKLHAMTRRAKESKNIIKYNKSKEFFTGRETMARGENAGFIADPRAQTVCNSVVCKNNNIPSLPNYPNHSSTQSHYRESPPSFIVLILNLYQHGHDASLAFSASYSVLSYGTSAYSFFRKDFKVSCLFLPCTVHDVWAYVTTPVCMLHCCHFPAAFSTVGQPTCTSDFSIIPECI